MLFKLLALAVGILATMFLFMCALATAVGQLAEIRGLS